MVFQSVEKCQAPLPLPMAWAAVDSLFLIILCFFFFYNGNWVHNVILRITPEETVQRVQTAD